tara:strand:- start:337 stop:471 length:135 start_codon:yes stop_codon:yes gene_type:complete
VSKEGDFMNEVIEKDVTVDGPVAEQIYQTSHGRSFENARAKIHH